MTHDDEGPQQVGSHEIRPIFTMVVTGDESALPHVSQSPRERLVAVLYQEVSADMRKVDQYHRMSRDHWRSVRRLGVSIAELRDLDD
ncbi:hypothetical protein Tco_0832038 [Tanacetum coccineum]